MSYNAPLSVQKGQTVDGYGNPRAPCIDREIESVVSRSVDRRESGSHRVIALQRRTSLESQKILPAQDVERVKVLPSCLSS